MFRDPYIKEEMNEMPKSRSRNNRPNDFQQSSNSFSTKKSKRSVTFNDYEEEKKEEELEEVPTVSSNGEFLVSAEDMQEQQMILDSIQSQSRKKNQRSRTRKTQLKAEMIIPKQAPKQASSSKRTASTELKPVQEEPNEDQTAEQPISEQINYANQSIQEIKLFVKKLKHYSKNAPDGSRCLDTASKLKLLRNQVVQIIKDLEAHLEDVILNADLSHDEQLGNGLIEDAIMSAFTLKKYIDLKIEDQECKITKTSFERTRAKLRPNHLPGFLEEYYHEDIKPSEEEFKQVFELSQKVENQMEAVQLQ